MTYDCIVMGVGGVGSATLYHLARRGVNVLGLDRFAPGHHRGSSHGRTRIIRQAYFEHPDYVPLLRRAYDLWAELEATAGEKLYHEVGLLQIGPADGLVVPGVLRSAKLHNLPVESLSATEIRERFPGFCVADHWQGVLEQRAGYLRVEACVEAHARAALNAGATLQTDAAVVDWQATPEGVTVRTDRGAYHAKRLIITAGAWADELLHNLGVPLIVRRQPQFWFANHDTRYRADAGCPTFLFETPTGVFYGFPDAEGWGVKAASHSSGELVSDPLSVDRTRRAEDERQIVDFLRAYLPSVTHQVVDHEVCLYTMSPDEHFLVDRHSEHDSVYFAAGLSGHGFKFTAVLGEALADLATSGRSNLPIDFLSIDAPGRRLRSPGRPA